MKKLYNWAGKLSGFVDSGYYYNNDGVNIGKVVGDEIYSTNGTYLGELVEENRLLTKKSKKSHRKSPFPQKSNKSKISGFVGHGSFVMRAGYEDFPNLG